MSAAAATTKYWVLGEFNDSDALLSSTTKLREEKAGELDTYTAYPVHGIEEALGLKRSKVTFVAFAGGLTGAITAWSLQLYFNYLSWWHGYAVNIGNKPPHAPPVYVPVTFELMVLLAGLSIVGSLIVYFWGFPHPHHPVFESEAFVKTASTSGWWVSVTLDAHEKVDAVRSRLEALGAKNVSVVEDAEDV
jgi:hypothetical protein